MDFALHIHTYIKIKNPSFFLFFFPSDGGKLSIKTTVEKKPKKSIISHFSATHTLKNVKWWIFFSFFFSTVVDGRRLRTMMVTMTELLISKRGGKIGSRSCLLHLQRNCWAERQSKGMDAMHCCTCTRLCSTFIELWQISYGWCQMLSFSLPKVHCANEPGATTCQKGLSLIFQVDWKVEAGPFSSTLCQNRRSWVENADRKMSTGWIQRQGT